MVDSTSPRTLTPPKSSPVSPTYFWRRRRFWIWSLVLFIIAVVGFVASLPTTRALVQFHRVKAGMMEADVVDLMGKSSGHFESERYPGYSTRAWYVGELTFFTGYQDGKIIEKRMNTELPIMHRVFPSLFDRNLL